MNHITVIILAAGKGTRINSSTKNKVVRRLAGQPMISYTLKTLNQAGLKDIITVIGFKKSSVQQVLGNRSRYVIQKNRLGTGHAVKTALSKLKSSAQHVLVLNGDDSAFYSPQDITNLISTHRKTRADMTLMTVVKSQPGSLGRIIRNSRGQFQAIVEFKNATPQQKKIKEVNTATYCFKASFLKKYISQITKNPVSQEYYLTDLLEIAVKNRKKVSAVKLTDPSHFHGVNTLQDLKQADQQMARQAE